MGVAKNIPGIPHKIPQNIRLKRIVMGCRSRFWPMIFGSMTLPIMNWIEPGMTSDRTMRVGLENCNRAIGRGRRVANIEPIVGIKLSKKANRPNINAISRSTIKKKIAVRLPVANDVKSFVVKYPRTL